MLPVGVGAVVCISGFCEDDWYTSSFLKFKYSIDIIMHDLSSRHITTKIPKAHKGKVSGLCYASADTLLSCGVDRTVKLWSISDNSSEDNVLVRIPKPPLQVSSSVTWFRRSPWTFSPEKLPSSELTFRSVGVQTDFSLAPPFYSAVDHHRSDRLFATASNTLQIWDETKCVSASSLSSNNLSWLFTHILYLWLSLDYLWMT